MAKLPQGRTPVTNRIPTHLHSTATKAADKASLSTTLLWAFLDDPRHETLDAAARAVADLVRLLGETRALYLENGTDRLLAELAAENVESPVALLDAYAGCACGTKHSASTLGEVADHLNTTGKRGGR